MLINYGEVSETYSTIYLLETFAELSSSWSVISGCPNWETGQKAKEDEWSWREVFGFWQSSLLKPLWAGPRRLDLKVSQHLESEITCSKGTWNVLTAMYMFLLSGKGYMIHFRKLRHFLDYIQQRKMQLFLVTCIELNNPDELEIASHFDFGRKWLKDVQ